MPELPEIETTKCGIAPFLLNKTILRIDVRQHKLRIPVTPHLNSLCREKILVNISRRAKYLILHLSIGNLLIHLGMSGHLRIVNEQMPAGKHDHIDLCLTDNTILRYHDPRRFGLWLYFTESLLDLPLLAHLGPEPLTNEFNGDYLYQRAHQKTQPIKSFIMDNKIVVGIGNIYATESLFLAGIHPKTPAGLVSKEQLSNLCLHAKQVLQQAINVGGTTLRDFYAADGKPGYFSNKLKVYGRQNHPCYSCATPIEFVTLAGRRSAFCPKCQPMI